MKFRFASHLSGYRVVSLTLILTLVIAGVIIVGLGEQSGKATSGSLSTIAGCPLFPANNIWNRDISNLPVSSNSANFIASIGITGHLHADFGAGLYAGEPLGIPYTIAPGNQPSVPVSFGYADESDPGPYPIPANAPIEGGSQSSGDRHVIVVDSGTCKLYEMYASYPQSNGSWKAGSGAVWNLNSNALRPAGWTSADAAGLPILPGLVRYDEVAGGAINHALRFTVNQSQRAYIWPARHFSSSNTKPNVPPMGLRLRLKASVNISTFSPTNRIILTALQHYGMIEADNGSSWYLSGAPDNRWNNDVLRALSTIPGSDFEVVDESALQVSSDSGQAVTASSSAGSTPTPVKVRTQVPSPTSASRGISKSDTAEETRQRKDSSRGGNTSGAGINPLLVFGLVCLGIFLLVSVGLAQRLMARNRR